MIQRAQDAPRRGLDPPRDLGAGLALFGAAAALRAGMALLAPGSLPAVPPAADALIAPLSPWLLSQALGATHSHPLTLPALAVLTGALAAPAASGLTAGLFGPTAGRAVGWSVALSPFLLAGALVLDANAFALAVLLALAAGAAWLRTPRRGRAFGTGLLCGIATLASFPGALLAPLILVWSWRPLGLTVPPRERLNQTGLVLLGLCVVATPWAIGHTAALGRWAQGPVPTLNPSAVLGTGLPRHPLLAFLAMADFAWLLLAAWGAVRTLSGPRRWYQSLPLIALLALLLAALTATDAFRARLGFEPLVALLAALGALHARRAIHFWRRGVRLVRGGNTRPPSAGS